MTAMPCWNSGAQSGSQIPATKPFSPNELRTRVASIHLRSQVARDPGRTVAHRLEVGRRHRDAQPVSTGSEPSRAHSLMDAS